MDNLIISSKCTVSETGITFDQSISQDEWKNIGRTLQRINGSIQWWIGDWLNFGEKKWGEMYTEAMNETGLDYGTLRNYKYVSDKIDLSLRSDKLPWTAYKEVSSLEPNQQKSVLSEGGTTREIIAKVRELKKPESLPLPEGKYQCLVIDPPWPIEKIQRDVRPNQVEMDYPVMAEEELMAWGVPSQLAADNCHLYLWVTHRFLPLGLELTKSWGFNYQCLMTWVKNVGITPYSWMYSTEHVIFANRGHLPLEQLGKRLDFAAKVREHSRKPDEFYDLVRLVSPGPRIDLFAREQHEGFATWGNERTKFNELPAGSNLV